MSSRFGEGLKQLQPVGPNGATLMDYAIHDALAAGFGRVVFVTRPKLEPRLEEAVGRRWRGRADVVYAHQRLDDLPGRPVPAGRSKPWGTAHAVLAAAPHLDGPFAVVNADDFYGREAYRLVAAHFAEHDDGGCVQALPAYRLRQTLSPHGGVSRAVCQVDGDGYLTGVREVLEIRETADGIVGRAVPEALDGAPAGTAVHPGVACGPGLLHFTGEERISANFWGFTTAALDVLRSGFADFLEAHAAERSSEYRIPDALAPALADGRIRVRVLDVPGPWAGVTFQADVADVRAMIRGLIEAGDYPEDLFQD
jgi:hypothetical protein